MFSGACLPVSERPWKWPLIRVIRETYDAPTDIRARVAQAGGLNWLGEPNFRVVWGGSRLAWVGGKWIDRDENGCVVRECVELRQVPKYLPTDRWHVERWMPAEAYGSPDKWWTQTVEAESGIQIPALGPYPSRGEYEHCFTLQSAQGKFVPLSPAACDWIVRAVEWARRQPPTLKRAALEDGETKRESDWENAVDSVLDLETSS